jgi:MarR family transcriptional regulator, organic hydroperoxide resistance regulator
VPTSRKSSENRGEAAASSAPVARTEAAERFTAAWDEFVLAIRRAQARGQAAPQDLTLAQYYLLLPLRTQAKTPSSQLAELAGIAAPTATRLLDGLERTGLVVRERSPDDRRTVLVSLTRRGRDRLRQRERQLAHRRRLIFERLAPEEREQSERLLRHLAEVIAEL